MNTMCVKPLSTDAKLTIKSEIVFSKQRNAAKRCLPLIEKRKQNIFCKTVQRLVLWDNIIHKKEVYGNLIVFKDFFC